jgi:hypothetical protein
MPTIGIGNRAASMSWFDNLTKDVSDAILGEDKESGGSSETAAKILTERRSTALVFWLIGKTGEASRQLSPL